MPHGGHRRHWTWHFRSAYIKDTVYAVCLTGWHAFGSSRPELCLGSNASSHCSVCARHCGNPRAGWTADQVLDLMLHNPEDLCVMSPEGIHMAGQAPAPSDPMHPQGGYGQPEPPVQIPQPTAHVPPTLVDQVLSALMDMEVEEEATGEPVPGSVDTNVTTSAPATPQQTVCPHERVTKKGSIGYYLKETCLDCGLLLKNEKKMIVGKNAQPVEGAPGFTNVPRNHNRCTWRGSSGINWRNTCLDCGKVTRGSWSNQHIPKPPHLQTNQETFLRGATGQPVHDNKQFDSKSTHELMRSALMVATIKLKENNGILSLEEIHRIIDAVSVNLDTLSPDYTGIPTMPTGPTASTAAAPKAPPPSDQSDILCFHGTKTITFGKHKGHPFWYAWQDENYVNWVLAEVNEGSSRGVKDLAHYFREKKQAQIDFWTPPGQATPPRTPARTSPQGSPAAYMAFDHEEHALPGSGHQEVPGTMSEVPQEPVRETHLLAILDSGCNRACHGDRWMQRYQQAIGPDVPPGELRQSSSSIKGINGQVSTSGTRRLEVCFQLESNEDSFAVGTLDSTELSNSDAPLLLSIKDQRRLQLQVNLSDDTSADKVYSRLRGGYLKVTDINGFLGLHDFIYYHRKLPRLALQALMTSKLTMEPRLRLHRRQQHLPIQRCTCNLMKKNKRL